MSTVLAYTSPALGHLYPMVPLLLAMQRRGHDVHVRTLDTLVDQVRQVGLAAEPIDPRLRGIRDDHPDYVTKSPKRALEINAEIFSRRGRLDGRDLQRAVEEVSPDLLVVDTNAWGAVVAASASGLPWAQFAPYVLPLPSRGTPPYGPGLLPRSGPWGRLRDALVGRLVMGAVDRGFTPRLNELRSAVGLPPVDGYADFLREAPLLLMTTSEPFDHPNRDWPATVRRIGALGWEPAAEPPPWLADLPDPLVVVTTSSEYQADEALALAAIEGLGHLPGSLVVTMPAGVPADLPPLPEHVRVEQFVPHAALLERASVAVTHGGLGSTQKALAAGVPVCVVPFGRDQLETAARVVTADCGTRLSRRRLDAGRLRDAVQEAATKRPGARRVAEGYRAAGGAEAGADALEALLPRRPGDARARETMGA